MNISIELIDEMRKRTNCSYQEAKELLEKHNGDMIEAIIDFERKQGPKSKHKNHHHEHNHGEKAKSLFNKGFKTRFIIEKDGSIILNISVNVLILGLLLTMPVIILDMIFFVVIYLMGYKIRIRKEEGKEVDINEFVDDLSTKVKTAADKMTEKPVENSQTDHSNVSEKKDDDYNEITIEKM